MLFQSLYQAHPKGVDSHSVIEFPEKISVEAKSILQEVSFFVTIFKSLCFLG